MSGIKDRLQIHCDPDLDEKVTENEWVIFSGKLTNMITKPICE